MNKYTVDINNNNNYYSHLLHSPSPFLSCFSIYGQDRFQFEKNMAGT